MFHAADGPTAHRITWLGGTHVIMKKFIAEKAFEYIEKFRISRYRFIPNFVHLLLIIFSTMLIPTMINSLNQVSPITKDVSSMKRLMFGGSPCATGISFVLAIES
jgi:hypothetical protein